MGGAMPPPQCRTDDDCPGDMVCNDAGQCEGGECDCPAVIAPVCGIDGNTYDNACLAMCAEVEIAAQGPCADQCEPLACDLDCGEAGFAQDAAGCDICACAGDPPPECPTDEDVCRAECAGNPIVLPMDCSAPAVCECAPECPPPARLCAASCEGQPLPIGCEAPADCNCPDACPGEDDLCPFICLGDMPDVPDNCALPECECEVQCPGPELVCLRVCDGLDPMLPEGCEAPDCQCVDDCPQPADFCAIRCGGGQVDLPENCRVPRCECDNCPADEVSCGDGVCIEQSWECDEEEDCADGRDEQNCEACRAHQFQCLDGSCIAGTDRCDGVADCLDDDNEDRSDEAGCGPRCPVAQAYCIQMCRGDEMPALPEGCDPIECNCRPADCINPDLPGVEYVNDDPAACDGLEFDCPDPGVRFDNACGCGCFAEAVIQCEIDEFRCADGVCIDAQYLCDDDFDCAGGEDEAGCGPACPAEADLCAEQCADPEAELIVPEGCPLPACECELNCPGLDDPRYFYVRDDPEQCDGLDLAAVCEADEVPFLDECGCGCLGPEFVCDDDAFQCADGGCIRGDWACDFQRDCADGSDENPINECEPEECFDDEFQCRTGECLFELYRCDDIEDCMDGDDELNCGAAPECPPEQATCERICADRDPNLPEGCRVPQCNCAPRACQVNRDCAAGDLCRDGRCVPDCACPDEVNRVCGVDGQTYDNACRARCAGVEIEAQGQCR